MAKRMIIYETINGEKEILSTIAIDKIKLEDIVSFTIISDEDVLEKYVIGVPFLIDNFAISYGLYNMISQWRRCDFAQILYTYGSLAISDEASYYIDTYTNSLIEKDDNVHVIANQMRLIKLLEEFIIEMTKGNVKKRTIR